MENFTENYSVITDIYDSKRLVHNDHLDSSYKGYQLKIYYKILKETHDGYCSDPYDFNEEEEVREVNFWVLLFSKEFINKNFTGHPKFIGTIDDIIKYFTNYQEIPNKLEKKINVLKNLNSEVQEYNHGNVCCECKTYYNVTNILIIDKYLEKEYIPPNNLY